MWIIFSPYSTGRYFKLKKPHILCASELSVENVFEQRLISNVIPNYKLYVDKECPRTGVFMSCDLCDSSNAKIVDTFFYDEIGQ